MKTARREHVLFDKKIRGSIPRFSLWLHNSAKVAQLEKLTFPHIPNDLLDELEKRFPDRMPDLQDNLDHIRVAQGQVSVIRFLKHQFQLQNQNILET